MGGTGEPDRVRAGIPPDREDGDCPMEGGRRLGYTAGMNLILLIVVLLLLFGGGGFYIGGPAIGGGGLGLVLLIVLIIYLMGGFRAK
jgi:hypothetical protein